MTAATIQKYFPPSTAELDLRYHFADFVKYLIFVRYEWPKECDENNYLFRAQFGIPPRPFDELEIQEKTFDEFVLQREKPIDLSEDTYIMDEIGQHRIPPTARLITTMEAKIRSAVIRKRDLVMPKDKDYSLGLCEKLYREGATPNKTTWLDGYAPNDKLAALNAKLHRE